jgi:glutamyl-tRNA synthetase
MTKPIITRFAPSPTGYLHIGGARTALFNWLYARKHKGKFLLRIEDTDRARHNENAVKAIIDGLNWFGLDWDGAPVSQYENAPRHREVAEHLLASGNAYRCWLSGDDLTAARDAAKQTGKRFESKWRDADPASHPDTPFAIRLKAPQTGVTKVEDVVQGMVEFSAEALDDMVLLRSDGNPTYMLAVVVDDFDMGVTHVIRGDDHLVNAARQQQLYEALNWPLPVFAHMPLIHGSDGAKLSKRHGALGIEAYRDMGYLPDALRNYLLRLGWSHGDDEIISTEQALQWFDIAAINKAPSRLDLDKLNHLNSHYINQMNSDDFLQAAQDFLPEDQQPLPPEIFERLQRGAEFVQSRCKTLKDFPTAAGFLLATRPLEITGKAAKPLKREGAQVMLGHVIEALEPISDWQSVILEKSLADLAERLGVGFGQIGPPCRAALTAGTPSPGLGELLYALGREESLNRLKDQVN